MNPRSPSEPTVRVPGDAAVHVGIVACLVFLLAGFAVVGPVSGGFLRPVEGFGNFHSIVDVHNRWAPDGESVDVTVIVAVSNRELTFVAEEGELQARVKAEILLKAPDGREVSVERLVKARTSSRAELHSASMYQIFTVLLEGVPFTDGKLSCRLLDENRLRPGLLDWARGNLVRSEASIDWHVDPERRLRNGLALGDPIFLADAPLSAWGTSEPLAREMEHSELFTCLHPDRRYGLGHDRLQVFFEIEPPTDGTGGILGDEGILMQVMAKDLDFALRDTLRLDEVRLQNLAAGRSVGLFFELDVNALPPGPYHLSCWPDGSGGRGWLAEFDVTWSLDSLNRHVDEVLAEGRTVLMGDDLQEFLFAGKAEREAVLERFWSEHDPDPETTVNEAYLEFRERIAFVRTYYGGFNRLGAVDPRGRVYVLLGEPDKVHSEVVPANSKEFDDALVRLYDMHQPQRPGPWAKGPGGIPLERTYMARIQERARRTSTVRDKAFELWGYENRGRQLFENIYSNRQLGMSFLFVDRTGVGHYHLEATDRIEAR